MKLPALPTLALIGLIILKVSSLLAFGPRFEPDSQGYLEYANLILHDTQWWSDAGLDRAWLTITTLRPIGYPALIALCQWIAGPLIGLYVVVLVQIAVSVGAIVMVWRISSTILSSRAMALIATAGFALSLSCLYDQSILSDSLFNSLFIIIFGLAASRLLHEHTPDIRTVLLAAALLVLAVSIRGITIYVYIFLIPIWLGWFWAASTPRIRTLMLLTAFVLPMVMFYGVVETWNYARTGQAFYVTNLRVPLQSMFKAAARGRKVFDGDTTIDKLAHETSEDYSYPTLITLSVHLFSDYGMKATEAIKLENALYFRSWRNHPGAMLENGVNNFHQSIPYNFFDVIDIADEIVHITTERHLFPGTKAMWNSVRKKGDAFALLMITVTGIGRIGSWFMLALFLFGVPISVYRAWKSKRAFNPSMRVLLAGWLLFWGYVFTLVLLHWVTRFLPAVLPWGLIGSLYVVESILRIRFKSDMSLKSIALAKP